MFTIFIRGTDVGQEQVALVRSGSQWIISSTGRLGDFTSTDSRSKHAVDWQPIEMHVEGTQAGNLATKARRRSSIDVIRPHQRDQRDYPERRDQLEDRSDFRAQRRPADQRLRRLRGARARLANANVGTELPTYVAAGGEVRVSVKGISEEAVTTPAGIVKTQKSMSSSFMAGTARARRSR